MGLALASASLLGLPNLTQTIYNDTFFPQFIIMQCSMIDEYATPTLNIYNSNSGSVQNLGSTQEI
jgi:hypothetical protein